MPALFEQGFFVRKPAWHHMGVVLDHYPGREEAMHLAGHDWDVIETPIFNEIVTPVDPAVVGYDRDGEVEKSYAEIEGWKQHRRSDNGYLLHVSKDSFERIPNSTAYEVAELLIDGGFQYETGITLEGGKTCALTLLLDEPIQITGDNSITLPYAGLSWAHDGSASLKVRSTSVRQVCANTVSASEAEAARLGTDFTFRHTKNVQARIEDAKMAIKGVRDDFAVYAEIMEELAAVQITPAQRELFVSTLIPMPPEALISDRVKKNVEDARAKVDGIFSSATMPEAHQYTAYGMHLAGVEYLDHLRGFRNTNTYVGRTLLRDEPAKKKLRSLIREVVKS